MALEEAAYEVIRKSGRFELRDYAHHIVAETIVEGSLEDAGGIAFRRLFRYISGDNRLRRPIDMTAPAVQEPVGEKIAMTAPVNQQQAAGKWAVSFTMPAASDMAALPVPNDQTVTLRPVPARRMAAVRYSGTWSEKNFLKYKEQLEAWLRGNGYRVNGEPVWARYNPPFTLWFLRRNEVLLPVASGPDS